MKVNFKRVKFYTGIDRKTCIEQDTSLEIANLIYRYSDIRGLRLAEKIYQADGDVEITNEEADLICNLMNQYATAMTIDAINHLFNHNILKDEKLQKP